MARATTLTIVALAIRQADLIAADLNGQTL